MRQAREHDTVFQPHAYLVFPLSHPSLISQYRILAAQWLVVVPSNQWTRVDPGPLTEPTAHRYQLSTLTPACAWLIWLLLSLMCVPVEPRRVGLRARF